MAKCLKMKSTKSTNTDSEERYPFGTYNMLLTKKEISRIYEKRRKSLLNGYCIRCGKELKKLDNLQCGNCDTNLQEFCFESDLKSRDRVIHDFIYKIKFPQYKF